MLPSPSLRDGIKPSTVYLPKLPEFSQKTVLEYLIFKFPHISAERWRQRFMQGKIMNGKGQSLTHQTPYQHGQAVLYYRELPPNSEPMIPFKETILHLDAHLIVVDKPHFLPVIPSGRYVNQALLTRLRLYPELSGLDIKNITPIHRLDKDTAGVMLFSHNLASRSQYAQLFSTRKICKTYHAIAPVLDERNFPFEIRSRLVRGEPFFTTQTVAGEVNAITRIHKLGDVQQSEENGECLSLYELNPLTGKKHQLRVHLNSLGIPIINDRLYPTIKNLGEDDYTKPLQLLAKRLEFIDPITGEHRRFDSEKRLMLAE